MQTDERLHAAYLGSSIEDANVSCSVLFGQICIRTAVCLVRRGSNSAGFNRKVELMIDVHSHVLLPIWLKAASTAGEVPPGGTPEWSVEKHLAVMDRYGITASVLSWPRATHFLKGQAARDLAREINEELAGIVTQYPKKFGAFAALPLDDLNATVEEAVYALDVLGLDGISCSSNIDGAYLGDSRFDEWFAEMDRRAVTLFVHPALPKAVDQVASGINAAILEFMFDTTRMATNMVLSGAKRRFSNIRMICTHAGGTVPYLASRISVLEPIFGAGPNRPVQTAEQVLEGLGTFYFDLTASTAAAVLDALRHLVPPSQLLAGYDFPLMPETTIGPAIGQLERYPNFSTEERRMILTGTLASCFLGSPQRANWRSHAGGGRRVPPHEQCPRRLGKRWIALFADLTCFFWTKLCEKLSLERSFGYAEEAVQRGADRGGASSDRSVDVAGQGNACGLPGSRNFAAELLSRAQGIRRT